MTNISTIVLAVAITRVVNVEVSSRLARVLGGAAMMIARRDCILLLRQRGRTPEGGDGQEQHLSAGLLDRPISIPATLSLAGLLLLLLVVTRGAGDVLVAAARPRRPRRAGWPSHIPRPLLQPRPPESRRRSTPQRWRRRF
ncbi:hypothetical protein ACFWAY_44925 [Rhodococcus sp. NPDC059968]|uniref:hypothetical protein n=1 Tax=Rhodococcus sp. NPDC059968 TaxID=3347017 RepID=UPI0036730A42